MPKDRKPSAADLFSWDNRSGRQSGGWSNKLIWGDNKLVLAALKNGPLRKEIEDAGGLKLVYIDPRRSLHNCQRYDSLIKIGLGVDHGAA